MAKSSSGLKASPLCGYASALLCVLCAGLAACVALMPQHLQPPPNTASLLMFDGVW